MKKSTRIVRKYIATLLIVLMSIESFGAVVGDNDGSAFITKAEFDSLKNNFQSQIDQYNTSIDSKIDGAISAYLSGIKVETAQVLNCPVLNYSEMKWVNDLYFYGMKRKWNAGETTTYTDGSTEWQRLEWMKHRYVRAGGTQNIGTWLGAGPNGRAVFWDLTIEPDSNPTFGLSDFINNRTNKLAPPVLVLNTEFNNGDHVLANNKNKLYIESMCDVYNELVPRYMPAFSVHSRGTATDFWQHAEWLVITPQSNVTVDCDDDSWLKLSATIFNQNYMWIVNDDGTYAQRTLDEIPGNYVWDVSQDFHEDAGSIWQPADTFLGSADDTRNYGFRPLLKWIDDGGGINGSSVPGIGYSTEIKNNQGNNFSSTFNWTSRPYWVKLENILNDFMLGQDSNQVCNVGEEKSSQTTGITSFNYDWSNSEWVKTSCNYYFQTRPFGYPKMVGTDAWKNISYNHWDYRWRSNTQGVTGNVKLPLWPRATISELKHEQFTLNKEFLKTGQGLPLVSNIPHTGTLELRLKYKIDDIDGGTSTSQKAKLYIKNNDFSTNKNDDYYTNTASTGTRDGSLNGYEMESNDTLVFKFPVKDGNSVWLRLSPYDTNPSGIYGTITDIRMRLLTDN